MVEAPVEHSPPPPSRLNHDRKQPKQGGDNTPSPPPLNTPIAENLALELHTESAPDMNISWCKLDT
jgi:hypothetical protein